MFGNDKGDKAQSVRWTTAKDGGVLSVTDDVLTYKLAAVVAVPAGQFTYLVSKPASHVFGQFDGRCSLIGPGGVLLN